MNNADLDGWVARLEEHKALSSLQPVNQTPRRQVPVEVIMGKLCLFVLLLHAIQLLILVLRLPHCLAPS
jgi:hypothetical protein